MSISAPPLAAESVGNPAKLSSAVVHSMSAVGRARHAEQGGSSGFATSLPRPPHGATAPLLPTRLPYEDGHIMNESTYRKATQVVAIAAALIALVPLLIVVIAFQDWVGKGLQALLEMLAFALLVLILWYALQQRRRRIIAILPFQNRTGSKDDKERYDALAANFADLLRLELQRINEIRTTSTELAVIAGRTTQGVRSTILTGKIGDDELSGTLKSIGDITIGPVHLPLGGLLAFAARARKGSTISGSMQMHSARLAAVASFGDRIWAVSRDWPHDDISSDNDVVRELARDLAYEMLADITRTAIKDTNSYRRLIEGLEAYQQYLRSSNQDTKLLAEARDKFEQSAILDRQFALAYYNLGLTLRRKEPDSAIEMFKLAIQCEPHLLEAHYGIAQAEIFNDQIDEAIRMGTWIVNICKGNEKKKSFPIARGFLGYTLAYKARYLLDDSHDDEKADLYREAITHYEGANRELEQEQKKVRSPRNGSMSENIGIAPACKINLQRRAKAFLQLAEITERRAATAGTEAVDAAYNKAQCALSKAVKAGKHDAGPHILLGNLHYHRHQYHDATQAYRHARDIVTVIGADGAWAIDPPEIVEDMRDMLRETWAAVTQRTRLGDSAAPGRSVALANRLELIRFLCRNELMQHLEQIEPDEDKVVTWMIFDAWAQALSALFDATSTDDVARLDDAIAWLGKVVVYSPVTSEIYSALAELYETKAKMESLLIQIDTSPSQAQAVGDASHGETNSDQAGRGCAITTQIALAYRKLEEAIAETSDDGDNVLKRMVAALPHSADLSDSPSMIPDIITGAEAWALGWANIYYGHDADGVRFLDHATRTGCLPEAKFAHFERGRVYYEPSQEKRALGCFSNVSEMDPWYWHSLWTQTASIRTSEAYREIIRAINVALDKIVGTPLQRALTLQFRAEAHRANKRYAAAIADCQQAAFLTPGYREPYWQLAWIYYEIQDYDRAIESLQHMVKVRPDQETREYHLGLATMYRKKADENTAQRAKFLEMAVGEYERAIVNAPDERGWTDLRSRPRNEPDITSLTRRSAVRIKPLNANNAEAELMDTHREFARVSAELKRYEAARAAWQRALALGETLPDMVERRPAIADIHAGLAVVLVRLKRFDEAQTAYQEAIRLYTQCCEEAEECNENEEKKQASRYRFVALARNDLAYFLHAERNWDLTTGMELARQALREVRALGANGEKVDGEIGAILHTQGWMYYQQGKLDKAQKLIQQAILLTKGTVNEHAHLALIYERRAERSMLASQRKQWKKRAREQWDLTRALDRDDEWAEQAKQYIETPPAK